MNKVLKLVAGICGKGEFISLKIHNGEYIEAKLYDEEGEPIKDVFFGRCDVSSPVEDFCSSLLRHVNEAGLRIQEILVNKDEVDVEFDRSIDSKDLATRILKAAKATKAFKEVKAIDGDTLICR